MVIREELFPDIGLQVLDRQRQTMIVGVDIHDHRLDALSLLQHFRRMLDPPRRDVGHVHEPVNALLDFDKGAEVREVANAAGDHGADGIAFRQRRPRIRFRLFEAQRYAAIVHVDIENECFDVLTKHKHFRRMLDALPCHISDMQQTIDTT